MDKLTPALVKPVVGIEVLEALDIRVGAIERVEEIPGSEKLMKLTVNFGDHSRTILAGIKKERRNPPRNREASGFVCPKPETSQNGWRDFRRYVARHRLCGRRHARSFCSRAPRSERRTRRISLLFAIHAESLISLLRAFGRRN